MAQKEPITILDIARHTGLSKGTVDRVLHNRGEVSRKSFDKVMQAIQELGYEPNIYASMLASHRHCTLVVLIPAAEPGTFWDISRRGIEKASELTHRLGAEVTLVTYAQYDVQSFRDACERVLSLKPDGVVLAPMYRDESLALTAHLKESGIPYVYIDSKLEEDDYLAYFGMPMQKSGYLCADLLTQGRRIPSVLVVRIQRQDASYYDPNVTRRAGFTEYMLANNPECSIHYLFIDPTHPERIRDSLLDFYKTHPEVCNLVMFNSRVYLIAPYLEEFGLKEMRIIGFDNLDANVDALRRGIVTMLIAQRPDEQVSLAIEALTDFILLKKLPESRDHFMHMDILTRYNVENY